MNKIRKTLVFTYLIIAALGVRAQAWSQVGSIDSKYQMSYFKAIGNNLYASLGYSNYDSATIGKWNGSFWTYYPGVKVKQYSYLTCDTLNDTLFIAYNDNGAPNSSFRVKKFSAGTWVETVVTAIQVDSLTRGSLKTLNNELYLFGDLKSGGSVINIVKYKNGVWSKVGPASKPGVSGGSITDISMYKNQLMVQSGFNGAIVANMTGISSANLLWDGTNWLKHSNVLDSVLILYNDNDTIFYQKDTSLYKKFNTSVTNLNNNIKNISRCSTFVAIKGVYYCFGDVTYQGGTFYFYSLSMLKDSTWKLIEKGISRESMLNYNDELHARKNPFPANAQVEKLNTGLCYIMGNVYRDLNNNCVRDATDDTLRNSRRIIILPDNYVTSTDWNGDYFAPVSPGIKTVVNNFYFGSKYLRPSSCSSNSKTVTMMLDSTAKVNFPMVDSPNVTDVRVKISPRGSFRVRKGGAESLYLLYFNDGSVDVSSGTLKVKLDNLFTVTSATPAYTSNIGNVVTWNIGTIQKATMHVFVLELELSSSATLGDSIQYTAWITPHPDADVTDNRDSIKCIIVSSYDPNEKQCNPAEVILPNTDRLDYVVNFQNTGTSAAINVYVVDTVDTNLPLDKIVITSWSTPTRPEIKIKNGNTLVFTFKNIMLPDSFSNEKASHGFIRYHCLLNSALPYGTRINNKAYIYFDYNPAVPTNTTSNIKIWKEGINGGQVMEIGDDVAIYPNPSNNTLYITSSDFEMKTISLINLAGQTVFQKQLQGLTETEIGTASLAEGIYIVKLENANQTIVKKLIVKH